MPKIKRFKQGKTQGYIVPYEGMFKIILDDGRVAFASKSKEESRIKVLNAIGSLDVGVEVKALGSDNDWHTGYVAHINHKDKKIVVKYKGKDGKEHQTTFPFDERHKHMRYLQAEDKPTGEGERFRSKYSKNWSKKSKYPYDKEWKSRTGNPVQWDKVKEVLDNLDFPEEDFRVNDEDTPSFSLGGTHYTTGGIFDPTTRKAHIYPKNIEASHAGTEYMGIVAHEVTHAMWDRVRDADEVKEYLKKHMDTLIDNDGHTDYSASWWKEFENHGRTPRMFLIAVNETLAEISSVDYHKGSSRPIHPEWQGLYEIVRKWYTVLRKNDKKYLKEREREEKGIRIWVRRTTTINGKDVYVWGPVKLVPENRAQSYLKKIQAERPDDVFKLSKSRPEQESV